MKFWGAALTALLATAAGAADAESMRTELERLLAEHPQVLAAESLSAAAASDRDAARAGYFPTFRAEAEYGVERFSADRLRNARTQTRNELALSLSQPIFDGYRTSGLIDAAGAAIRGSEATKDETERFLLRQGALSYLDVLRSAEALRAATDIEALIADRFALEERNVERGGGDQVALLTIRAQLQQAMDRRLALEARLAEAVARYDALFQHPPVLDAMSRPDALPEPPGTVDDALLGAAERPAIAVREAAANRAEAEREVADSALLPRVDLVGSWTHERDAEGFYGDSDTLALMLEARWALNLGMQQRHEIAAAAHRADAARHQTAAALRDAQELASAAWANYMNAKARLQVAEQTVRIAEQAADARRRRADAGAGDLSDVFLAEIELAAAEERAVDAYYEAQASLVDLLFASNRLTPAALGVAPVAAP